MSRPNLPLAPWLLALSEEDQQFLRRFLLCSGSIKALEVEYGVSYPTIRGRLDRLIEKVKAVEDPEVRDPFERHLRLLVADGQLASAAAKELLTLYRRGTGKRNPV